MKVFLSIVFIFLLFIIWKPFYELNQTPAPINYDSQSNGITTFQYLRYDKEIYDKYLKAEEHGGTPKYLDSKVESAMLNEKIIYTIGTTIVCLIIFFVSITPSHVIKCVGMIFFSAILMFGILMIFSGGKNLDIALFGSGLILLGLIGLFVPNLVKVKTQNS